MQQDFLHLLTAAAPPKTAAPAPSPEQPPRPAQEEAEPNPVPAPKPPFDFAGARTTMLEEGRNLLLGLGLAETAAKLQLRWNGRMRSTAGTAHAGKSLITLNPLLVSHGWEEIHRTFLHELAHIVAHARAGRRRISPHGPEWRAACKSLGLADEARCHELPLPRRKIRRKFSYECPSCKIVVNRVKPFQRKTACLACCKKYNRGRYDERFRFRIACPA